MRHAKRPCPICGVPILGQRSTRRYCSNACRQRAKRQRAAAPVLTALRGENNQLLRDVLRLYARPGHRILDMTYGRGLMWRKISKRQYRLITLDAVTPAMVRADFRDLPFVAEAFDIAILDPPYAGHGKPEVKPSLADCYQVNHDFAPRSVSKLRALYATGIEEAARVLKPSGVLIVKCQDQLSSGQEWIHAELLAVPGWKALDLFVLVQQGQPLMRWEHQWHARKNHSYFVVLARAA